jgi:hypothetical protein
MDKIETRGSWKRISRRVVDRYISVDQPHIDGMVEGVLCVGGTIHVALVDNIGITPDWLRSKVVPGLTEKHGSLNTVAEDLALPLVWTCLDSIESKRVSRQVCAPITVAFEIFRRSQIR